MTTRSEVWQRNLHIDGLALIFHPLAFALMEAEEEITTLMATVSNNNLHQEPAGCASIAFHLKHIAGVLDRMQTYAGGAQLSPDQYAYLNTEQNNLLIEDKDALTNNVYNAIHIFINTMKNINEHQLFEMRGIGRQQLPVTLWGLYVHAVEHTMRHLGQLLVTVKFVNTYPTLEAHSSTT